MDARCFPDLVAAVKIYQQQVKNGCGALLASNARCGWQKNSGSANAIKA